ncbi:chemotaxis protein CheA [Caldicellulosiruptor morganii]|uniref:Chemotaxis protein CheA n=1 Tax=Caldicellulosiruptor morganii TaxID=1387555 RepID=A0ABY7BRA5_9FIRM|nr:chemotaxis protein CheA [Caldicellulosiruptor morganii]WAM34616.1 chemotaxis protein CheA [Caldicellulosiruptor morganii]
MNELSKDPMFEIFISEAREIINGLEKIFIELKEGNVEEKFAIEEALRLLHTLKGSSAMMGYQDISKICHKLEDIFVNLKSTSISTKNIDKFILYMLKITDFLNSQIVSIENMLPLSSYEDIENVLLELESALLQEPEDINNEKGKKYLIVLCFEDGWEMENLRAFLIVQKLKEYVNVLEYFPPNIETDTSTAETIKREGFKILIETSISKEDILCLFNDFAWVKSIKIEEKMENEKNIFEKNNEREENCAKSVSAAGRLINVNIEKVDKLVDLIGEMVVTFSMLTQHPDIEKIKTESFKSIALQMSKLIRDIQEIAMSMRMVPLSSTFQKLKRIVVEMSAKLNKQVEVHISGEETELDKTLIEHLTDPLIHLIRNAVDHGIEEKDERLKKGKTPHGNIYISAKNSGSDVLITIEDDGRGLDRSKIIKKALERGLISEENDVDEQLVYDLIFHTGFSTKEEATEYSGRGVGLDIVKSNVQKIDGTVFVDSQKDTGTRFTIRIPLTLAIIDGMLVKVNEQIFVLPLSNVIETFKVEKEDIIAEGDYQFIYKRGACYKVIDLRKVFYSKEALEDQRTFYIGVQVGSSNKMAVLLVDEMVSQQQVVIKSLPQIVDRIKGISGCTLLGNGGIAMILDVDSLIERW